MGRPGSCLVFVIYPGKLMTFIDRIRRESAALRSAAEGGCRGGFAESRSPSELAADSLGRSIGGATARRRPLAGHSAGRREFSG